MASLEVLEERLKYLKEDLHGKHQQNRNDIHAVKGELEKLNNQIWLLKLKIAGWAGGGSAVSVGLLEFFKWLFHHQ